MPGLLDTQLSSQIAKFTAQKAHALVYFSGALNAAPNNGVTLTDGVTPEAYALADDTAPNGIAQLVDAINNGNVAGGPSALFDAYDIGGDVCLIVAQTAGAGVGLEITLDIAMAAFAADQEAAANGVAHAMVDGHAEEVEILVPNEHAMTAQEVAMLAGGGQVAISTVTLGEAPKLLSAIRRTAAGSYQSLVNVEIDLDNLAGDEYAILLTDAGAVLQTGDVIGFIFTTG